MLKLNFLFAFCLLFAYCYSQQTYQPPFFEDSVSRIQKIKATQTVIDKLYKSHATKNNFPGFVYAVVADGKLIYSGNVGYTDVEKKFGQHLLQLFELHL